jgi:drug/metabolite transporter (DMT)-like permease
LCTTLIWGSTFLFIRFGLESFPALWGVTVRLGLATVALTAVAALTKTPFPRGAALRAAAWFGFFQFGLNFSFLYWGQKQVPSGIAAVIFALIPLTNVLAARAFGLERLTPAKLLGAVIALTGVAVLSASQIAGRTDPWSVACIVLAVLSGTLGTVLLKHGPRQSPIASNWAGSIVGIAVALPASFLVGEPHPLPQTWNEIFPLLYLSGVGSIGAFVLFAYLINHWPVSRVGYISVCVPIIALTLGALVRGERIPPLAWLGTVIILAGVVVGLRAQARASGPVPTRGAGGA